MFTKEALQEAAPGHDVVTIARAIQSAGFLYTNDKNLNAKMQTPAGRVRVYCVMAGILSDDSTGQDQKTLGQLGQLGQSPTEQGLEPALHGKTPLGQLGQDTTAAPNSALAPYLQKTTRADEDPHSNGVCPSALPALPENTDTQATDSAEEFK
jgi:hypothetical protein